MIGADFLIACAPNIAPETLQQIIQVESKGDPLAIHVNKAGPTSRPTDKAHAAALAISYTAQGYSVDLGLMQVNNRNLAIPSRICLSPARILQPERVRSLPFLDRPSRQTRTHNWRCERLYPLTIQEVSNAGFITAISPAMASLPRSSPHRCGSSISIRPTV